jgi:YaiO family outer membrane protein
MTFLIALSLVAALTNGDGAMEKGDYAAAAQYYRAEVASHPDSYDAKFKLARALSFSNRRDEAIALYTELLAASPKNSDLLLARGRTYAWDGRWKEAEKDLKKVTAQRPGYGDAWSALGDVYLWSDRPIDAAAAYGKWIAADPGEQRAYLARAKAWRAAGNIDAARADFEAARTHGLPSPETDAYLASLQQRRQTPEAQATDEFAWLANLSIGRSDFSPVKGTWNYYDATLRHYWKQGSLGFEYLGSERFGSDDYALALDAYWDLWQRAYVNVRLQASPRAILFPDTAYRAELFQGVGTGWELSGSYDHMDFGPGNVDMYGAGLGKYVGDWYVRWKTLFIPSSAKLGISHRVVARYYYAGNGDDYAEINGGFGEGGEFLQGTGIIETTRSHSAGAAFQKYLDPRWGFKVSAGYGVDNKYPFTERSVSANIMRRW